MRYVLTSGKEFDVGRCNMYPDMPSAGHPAVWKRGSFGHEVEIMGELSGEKR